jgi:hypothetical protein
MVRTAPPETIEQAHTEAFRGLTPEQRRIVLDELTQAAPARERATLAGISSEDSTGLARAATRAEIREPGSMERVLGGRGIGFGTSLLGSFAAAFAGSLVAQSFFAALGTDAASDEASGEGEEEPLDENDLSGGDYGDGGLGGDFEL